MVSLSFVFSYFNRLELFRSTLDSFIYQSDRFAFDWELIVVDDGSTDDVGPLCKRYAVNHALPIRFFRIDVLRGPVPVFQHQGMNNPAVAKNVGIKQARYPRVVLSSPEIRHLQHYNLRHLALFELPPQVAIVANVLEYSDEATRTPYAGKQYIGGGPQRRVLDFLCAYDRQRLLDIGGFEEAFMSGWAWEDREFADRWERTGGQWAFSGDGILAEHQIHEHPDAPGAAGAHNHALYEALKNTVANEGREWGSDKCIVEAW